MSIILEPGSVVRLRTPDNEQLHGATGVVKALTDWGAFVATPAAASGEFRATWDEMEPLGDVPASALEAVSIHSENRHPSDRIANKHTSRAVRETRRSRDAARESGYTGDVCDQCGSFEVRRIGPCVRCDSCGASGGCG